MSGPRFWVVLAFGLSCLFALWRALGSDPVTDYAENKLIDLRFWVRGAEAAPGDVVLVAVDEAAVDALGWSPPPRAEIAEAIEAIAAAGAKVIALDMLFIEPLADDPVLAAALKQVENAVLAVAAVYDGQGQEVDQPIVDALATSTVPVVLGPAPAPGIGPPRLYTPNAGLAPFARLGHVNLSRGADRVARHAPLAVWIGEVGFLPAIAVVAAQAHLGADRGTLRLMPGREIAIGDRSVPIDARGRVPIAHYGPEATIPTVPLLDVLEGRVPATFFAGRAVIIGVTDKSFSDVFATPFGSDVPGAEVISTLTQNLISGDLLSEQGAALLFGLIAAPAVALALVLSAFAPFPWLWVGGTWLVSLIGLQVAFKATLLVDALSVAVALLLGSLAAQRIRAQRHRAKRARLELERGNLSRFVSPVLAEELASEGGRSLDKRKQDAAVLFADVQGYTSIAERMTPAEAGAFIRALHRVFEVCVEAHSGVIISFEGDGVMVAFGLPEPRPTDASRALDCGQSMIEAVADMVPPSGSGGPLRLRVGVNYGPVVAAVVGGDRQAHVTLSGDTVNVASRLQDVAKAQGASFVASRAVLDAVEANLGSVPATWSFLLMTPIRGRTGEIEVWAR